MINGVVYKNGDEGFTLIHLYTEKVHPVQYKENVKYEKQLTASSIALVEVTEPFQTVYATKPIVVVLLTKTDNKTVDVSREDKDTIIEAAYSAAKAYLTPPIPTQPTI